MYAAGRLECANTMEYQQARDAAATLGFDDLADALELMIAEEDRHERWFGDQIRDHWLLPWTARGARVAATDLGTRRRRVILGGGADVAATPASGRPVRFP